uniref:Uncharacterized protein n=1 Tax=Arundo donax TaxID=35708 RepID=A0A0A8YSM3_ARUDO
MPFDIWYCVQDWLVFLPLHPIYIANVFIFCSIDKQSQLSYSFFQLKNKRTNRMNASTFEKTR